MPIEKLYTLTKDGVKYLSSIPKNRLFLPKYGN